MCLFIAQFTCETVCAAHSAHILHNRQRTRKIHQCAIFLLAFDFTNCGWIKCSSHCVNTFSIHPLHVGGMFTCQPFRFSFYHFHGLHHNSRQLSAISSHRCKYVSVVELCRQPVRRCSIFRVLYVAVTRQVLVKLSNLLQCIVSSVNRTTRIGKFQEIQ